MKKAISIVLAILMLLGVFTVSALAVEREAEVLSTQPLPFQDVSPRNWFYTYVHNMHTNDVMQGINTTTFAPHQTSTRAHVLATLFRIYHGRAANPIDSRDSGFTDVTPNNWFAPYATWARANGIATGSALGGNQAATRQEMALFIHRYVANMTDLSSDSVTNAQWEVFLDRDQIAGDDAYHALRWANNIGIVTGISAVDTMTIAPMGTATRAQVAAMLTRLMAFLADAPAEPPHPPQQGLYPWSGLILPNARLTDAQRNQWIAEYQLMGGPFPFELAVIRLVNEIRTDHSLAPLQRNNTLMMAARFYAQSISNLNEDFDHDVGPYGGSFGVADTFRTALNCNVLAFRANGAAGLHSPQSLVDLWISTPGSRNNILNPDLIYIGMGVHADARRFGLHYMFFGT